eukprot:1001898-Rhodomonas_salina.1
MAVAPGQEPELVCGDMKEATNGVSDDDVLFTESCSPSTGGMAQMSRTGQTRGERCLRRPRPPRRPAALQPPTSPVTPGQTP